MSLRDRLAEDLKLAIKSRDQLRMDVIRLIKAAILNKELELKKDLDDAEMSRLMTTLIKQRRESIAQYQKAGRLDLAEKEQQEIAIIETYLPQAVSETELEALIESVITEIGARSIKERGTVIKTVMSRLAGRLVDGKRISDLVRAKLS
ncbi:MAG: GatB/YqeY domain-containing protein [Candidatus Caldarchaeum sp.]